MLIFKDVFSGDEMFSDAFPYKQVNDFIYEVKGKQETRTTKIDESTFGGNASAEGGDEGSADDIVESGINVVNFFGLQEATVSKKDYQKSMKSYLKQLMEYLNENGEEDNMAARFKSEFPNIIKPYLDNWKDFSCYYGKTHFSPDGEKEGMTVLLKWENEEDVTLTYIAPGLIKEKF